MQTDDTMVFFVHFLVCFGVMCAFTLIATLRWVALRCAPARRVTSAALPEARIVRLPRAAEKPAAVTVHVDFGADEATFVDSEPTRIWVPAPSARPTAARAMS